MLYKHGKPTSDFLGLFLFQVFIIIFFFSRRGGRLLYEDMISQLDTQLT